jgi:hypothetical protein
MLTSFIVSRKRMAVTESTSTRRDSRNVLDETEGPKQESELSYCCRNDNKVGM